MLSFLVPALDASNKSTTDTAPLYSTLNESGNESKL